MLTFEVSHIFIPYAYFAYVQYIKDGKILDLCQSCRDTSLICAIELTDLWF